MKALTNAIEAHNSLHFSCIKVPPEEKVYRTIEKNFEHYENRVSCRSEVLPEKLESTDEHQLLKYREAILTALLCSVGLTSPECVTGASKEVLKRLGGKISDSILPLSTSEKSNGVLYAGTIHSALEVNLGGSNRGIWSVPSGMTDNIKQSIHFYHETTPKHSTNQLSVSVLDFTDSKSKLHSSFVTPNLVARLVERVGCKHDPIFEGFAGACFVNACKDYVDVLMSLWERARFQYQVSLQDMLKLDKAKEISEQLADNSLEELLKNDAVIGGADLGSVRVRERWFMITLPLRFILSELEELFSDEGDQLDLSLAGDDFNVHKIIAAPDEFAHFAINTAILEYSSTRVAPDNALKGDFYMHYSPLGERGVLIGGAVMIGSTRYTKHLFLPTKISERREHLFKVELNSAMSNASAIVIPERSVGTRKLPRIDVYRHIVEYSDGACPYQPKIVIG